MIVRITGLVAVMIVSISMVIKGHGLTQLLGIAWMFAVLGSYHCFKRNYSQVKFVDIWIISILFFVLDHFFDIMIALEQNTSQLMQVLTNLLYFFQAVSVLINLIAVIHFGLTGLFKFFVIMQEIFIDTVNLLNSNSPNGVSLTNYSTECLKDDCHHESWEFAPLVPWQGFPYDLEGSRGKCSNCGAIGRLSFSSIKDDYVLCNAKKPWF